MSILTLMAPSSMVITSSPGSFTGATNILTENPKEIAVDAGGTPSGINFDLGYAQLIDTIFLGWTTGVATLNSRGGLTAPTDTDIPVATVNGAPSTAAIPRTTHFFRRLAAPVSVRFLRFIIAPQTGATMTVGVAAAGLSFQPAYGIDWGAGRRVIDTGSKERLLSGAFGVNRGAKAASYQWTFGNLSDAERDKLFETTMGLGETGTLLCVEDPDVTAGLNERLHWGMFTGLEAYEREFLGSTRWGFKFEDWA